MDKRVPNGLAALRALVSDFFSDPAKFLDLENVDWTYFGHGARECRVPVKPFREVTGLEYLGGGAYSDVYAIDETRVLKIVKGEDTGYERYVALVRSSKPNPFFPKVFYSGNWGGKRVYVLERLSNHHPDGRHESDTIKQVLCDVVYRFRNESGSEANRFYRTVVDPLLAEALEAMCNEGCTDDIGHSNIMFRGDQPVYTDPCAD